jgi:RecB family exonuclease
VGWKLRGVEEMLLELDFAKRCLQSLNLLGGIDLAVLPATWLRLLDELLAGEAVPFRGEPLEGLQVMGPLETRALDFRNIVLFSANEGVFPRRGSSASFVPPELRKGFGLPTFEYQDSVWAYYFYRLIQRAEHVWLVFDSRTEGLKTGEESRYIKQLQYHYQVPLERFVATARMELAPEADAVPKTQADIDAIRTGELSASSLQSYLYCPAKFYYSFIKRLKNEDEVLEAMDAGALGTVYHQTMQDLYGPFLHKCLTVADLDRMLQDRKALKALVRANILRQMQTVDVSGRDLVVEEVIVEYVLRTLRHDRDLLVKSGSKGFELLGLEMEMKGTFGGFRIKGYADRIDSYLGGEARIVDYKTGRVEQDDIDITDGNAAAVVDKLFGPANVGRPKIALQLFMYGLLAQEQEALRNRPLVNSIYSVSRLFTEPLEDRPASAEFARLTRERLKDLLAEMTDPSVPFRRTEERKTCEYCDFKMICGR